MQLAVYTFCVMVISNFYYITQKDCDGNQSDMIIIIMKNKLQTVVALTSTLQGTTVCG